MPTTTISTIIISTSRVSELAGFYANALDLGEPAYEEPNHIGFHVGENYFGFDKVEKLEEQRPGAVSLWFEVDDLDLVFEKCRTLGAKVKFAPANKPWGGRIAAVFDLDGNVMGLSQRKGAAH